MKKVLYLAIPSLLLCALILLGYQLGRRSAVQQFETIIQGMEQGETLAAVLAATPLTDVQRKDYAGAYHNPAAIDAQNISWSVPNQATPFVGTAPIPGQHHNAQINAWQMRSNQSLELPKPPAVYRIFLTGGSTAYGSGAPSQAATIGNLLQDRLNRQLAEKTGMRYEVFTFANPAWSSTQERIAIENYLSELEPDLILSLSGNNDVFWGHAGRNVLWYFAFADEYFQLLSNTAVTMTRRTAAAPLASTQPAPNPIPIDQVAYRLSKNVRLGKHALQAQNVPWVFFLQPTLSVTQKSLTVREASFLSDARTYYQQSYLRIAEKLSALEDDYFRFVNLSPVFDAHQKDTDIFLDQFHFGDKGNTLLADSMFTALLPQVLHHDALASSIKQ